VRRRLIVGVNAPEKLYAAAESQPRCGVTLVGVKRLQQPLVPRPQAGARRTQVRWSPIHGYQRDPPSRLLAPALLLRGEEVNRNVSYTTWKVSRETYPHW
jgi:hypothetical protein